MPDVREKLVELLGSDVCKYDICDDCECQGSTDMCIATLKANMADHLIANGVTIQRYGRWIPHNKGQNNWVECSVCNTVGSPFWKCCPVCETKMAQPPKGE